MKFGRTLLMILKRISNIVKESVISAEFLFYNSAIYREFLEEREEVLKHKWLESEKKGYDIGYSTALIDWILRHRTNWRNYRKNEK
jgi:hypothetical protein